MLPYFPSDLLNIVSPCFLLLLCVLEDVEEDWLDGFTVHSFSVMVMFWQLKSHDECQKKVVLVLTLKY